MSTTTTTTSHVTMARDNSLEAWFDSQGIKWDWVQDYDLSRVDEKGSLTVQSRVETRDKSLVDLYASQMNNGDVFPAIVVLNGGTTDTIPAGLHRFGALSKNGATHCNAYVLPAATSLDLISDLALRTNTVHGQRLTSSERMAWIKKYNSQGTPTDRIASIMNLSRSVTHKYVRVGGAEDRWTRLGGQPAKFHKLSMGIRDKAASIVMDEHFKTVIEICAKHMPVEKTVKKMCSALAAASSIEEQATILVAFEDECKNESGIRDRRSVTGREKRGKTGWAMFNMHSAAMLKYDMKNIVDSFKPSDSAGRTQTLDNAMMMRDLCDDLINELRGS